MSWRIPDSLEGFGGDSLVAWQQSLRNRAHFFCGWFLKGPPVSFWLGGFASPRNFVASLLRQHARSNRLDLDRLQMGVEATSITSPVCASHPEDCLTVDNNVHSPSRGAFVHGLALVGARWALAVAGLSGALDFSLEKEAGTWMPLLHLVPVLDEEHATRKATMQNYSCPVYRRAQKRAERVCTTALLSLDLASMQDASIWALQGVAIFLERTS